MRVSAVALALYFAVRLLPTGTNLSHMDFRAGASSVEFCDPANPQFMPVVSLRSPVTMMLANASPPATAGREARVIATLKTASGKPLAPEDLLVVHTQKLHLLLVDPTLGDYQHLHPSPGGNPGEWEFVFTPRRAGVYRVFADFTPAATARGLYASADMDVAAAAGPAGSPRPEADQDQRGSFSTVYEENGYVFSLRPAQEPLRAGRVIGLSFAVSRRDGGHVALRAVMGAYAHLVAFDTARSGFAHLHPNEPDLAGAPGPGEPRLSFKVTIPQAGSYIIWAQVNLGGQEMFAPFAFDVAP
jgi:hypothetical protein